MSKSYIKSLGQDTQGHRYVLYVNGMLKTEIRLPERLDEDTLEYINRLVLHSFCAGEKSRTAEIGKLLGVS